MIRPIHTKRTEIAKRTKALATFGRTARAALMMMLVVDVSAAAAQTATAQPPSGEAVYKTHCAACHDSTSPRIPPRAALQQMPAARIQRALDGGAMMTVALTMSRDER